MQVHLLKTQKLLVSNPKPSQSGQLLLAGKFNPESARALGAGSVALSGVDYDATSGVLLTASANALGEQAMAFGASVAGADDTVTGKLQFRYEHF